jgi:hypothetical protein
MTEEMKETVVQEIDQNQEEIHPKDQDQHTEQPMLTEGITLLE